MNGFVFFQENPIRFIDFDQVHHAFRLENLSVVLDSVKARQEEHLIPYNLASLTRLLQLELGGNSVTAFIATVASDSVADTKRTLHVAQKAFGIRQRAVVNNSTVEHVLTQLRREIGQARNQLGLEEPGDSK